MAAKLKDTVFKTGPNDSLRTVDIYGDGNIVDSALPTALGGAGVGGSTGEDTAGATSGDGAAQPPEELVFNAGGGGGSDPGGSLNTGSAEEDAESPREAIAPVKDNAIPPGNTTAEQVANATPETTAEALLATGATDNQIANKFDAPFPQTVPPSAFLALAPNENIGRLNEGTKAVHGKMGPSEYHNLLPADLLIHTQSVLDMIDRMNLNGVLCPAEKLNGDHVDDALGLGRIKIDIRKYIHCKKGKPEINLDFISVENKPHATRQTLNSAADNGAYDVLRDVYQNNPTNHTPGFKNQLIQRVLDGYKHKPGTTRQTKPGTSTEFVDTLDTIDPEWGHYNRWGEETSDLRMYNYANRETLDIMKHDSRTDVDAMVASDMLVAPVPARDLAYRKYPNLRSF